jgi:hypothetical protein
VRSEAVHFRYGDYSSLKRNYLPPDYLRDAAGLNIVKTVHEERCGIRPTRRARRAGSSESRANTAIRMPVGRGAYFARDDIERVLAAHAKAS